jgi:hypothetical protein
VAAKNEKDEGSDNTGVPRQSFRTHIPVVNDPEVVVARCFVSIEEKGREAATYLLLKVVHRMAKMIIVKA